VATGVAFGIKYKQEDGVVLCYFGDGAIHQGAFHESLNLAKVWQLPIVFICENNQYGMGTQFERVSAVDDFTKKGLAYDIPGYQVDGMDVLAVFEAIKEAVASAKAGNPVLIEVKTYRYRGHSMSDPATYRTRDEVDDYRKQDPILILRALMEEEGMLTEEQFKEIDEAARKAADEAVEFSEASEEPPLETLHEDVLA
jgi:pyruvate dehydrogenase E1 component alpha subunit